MIDDALFEVDSFLRSLTHRPGVYCMLDAKHKVIYVGKASDLKKRVASYFHRSQPDPKTAAMMKLVARVEVTVANTETEALILEYSFIKQQKPRFNILLRDDTNFRASNSIAVRGGGQGGISDPTQARALCVRRSTTWRSCF